MLNKAKTAKISSTQVDADEKIPNMHVFDYKVLEVLRKVGEGGFGVVRVCRYLKPFHDELDFEDESTSSRGSAQSRQSNKKPDDTDGRIKKATTEYMKRDGAPKNRAQSPRQTQFLSLSMAGPIVGAPKRQHSQRKDHACKFSGAAATQFALKIMSKKKIISSGQQEHLRNELTYMAQMDHPFIVKMHGVQQDVRNIYIMMDYSCQGELLKVVHLYNGLEPKLVRFYTAQILLCFEYMHKIDLIYRDLKPENILLSNSGYIKLTDFGFIKKLKSYERTYTLCGTPEYMAPEVIMNSGHGRAADFYTLGILMYELSTGLAPFMHEDPMEVFRMILSDKIRFPSNADKGMKSLIRHLTSHDLSKRYGNRLKGTQDIRNHRFFKDTNFDSILAQTEKSPFIPKFHKETKTETKGRKLSQIYENLDKVAPRIKPENDPFADWF